MIEKYFQFDRLKTNYRNEILGGLTTFLTMAYIIVVNPAILELAGIPKGPSMVATILSAFFGTFLMGVYARRPFAIAPYMGENAFITFTIVKGLGYSWQTALAAVFLAGAFFMLLTISNLRKIIAESVPETLKYSFAVGIGFFLTFIGLNECGIVVLGVPGAPVKVGVITELHVLLSIIGFLLIVVLMQKKVRGAILISILVTTALAFVTGHAAIPDSIMSMPPSLSPIMFQIDFKSALNPAFFPVILTIFLMVFVDTMGTLIGVSSRAGFLDSKGNLPDIQKPMIVDSASIMFSAMVGTTTSGAYIESAAGVESGGRSGFASVVTACLFLLALFFAPLLTSIPPIAYGPALITVGLLMMESIKKIDLTDFSETVPAFLTIILMSFTFNIGIGIMAGFIVYPWLKAVQKDWKEITWPRLVLAGVSLIFFISYPY